jgi:hypothetical protein
MLPETIADVCTAYATREAGFVSLSKKHGLSVCVIRRILVENGVQIRKPHTERLRSPETELQIKYYWEYRPDIPASVIAKMFGITKNALVGLANRRNWAYRREPNTSNVFTRTRSLHDRLTEVLQETQSHANGHYKNRLQSSPDPHI